MKQISLEKAYLKFIPYLLVFVISYDEKNKRPSGMIAGWNMNVSFEPYLFAVSLWEKGYTHKLIRKCKEFVIAIPNKKLEKAVTVFGSFHGDTVDKFKKSKIKTLKSKFIKPPLLKDATLNLECKLYKEIKSGDHIIFIGKVLAAYANKGKKTLVNMGLVNDKHIFREF